MSTTTDTWLSPSAVARHLGVHEVYPGRWMRSARYGTTGTLTYPGLAIGQHMVVRRGGRDQVLVRADALEAWARRVAATVSHEDGRAAPTWAQRWVEGR